MELAPRDARHLAGSRPLTLAPRPTRAGLAVDHRWAGTRARFLVLDRAGVLNELDHSAGIDLLIEPDRRCVGRWQDGRWVACPFNRIADRFDQCPDCSHLVDRDCVFNPHAGDCPSDFCNRPHRVYVAFYAELAKVGMTRAGRGAERMVEQGADAYAVVAHVPDRFAARQMEERVSLGLDIPQARRASELLPRLARPVPWDSIEERYAALAPRLGEITGDAPGPLERITDHPGRFPLVAPPVLAGLEGHHKGEVLGEKGKYVIYRAAPEGPLWALNLHGAVGHRVRFDHASARPVL